MTPMTVKKLLLVSVIICTLFVGEARIALADNSCMSVPGTYDDSSASITYNGPANSWTHGTGWTKACNTTVSWSKDSSASVSFGFNGSSITRKYTMASNRGAEAVYIDGINQGSAASYAPTTRWQVAKTWQVSPGNHTITVNVAGGPTSYSDLDAFVVNIPTVGAGIYDDTNNQLQYMGNWTHGTGWPNCFAHHEVRQIGVEIN